MHKKVLLLETSIKRTVAEVTQAIQTAQELNTAMGNLKNSLNDKDTTLGSQNFADADPEKKNAYNEAVHNAKIF